MPHSLVKIWIHAVWSTKYRAPLINSSLEPVLYQMIYQQLEALHCHIGIINGMPDHIHCLFRINAEKSIAEVMKQIKGSTSHYINENKLISENFAWQTGYAAFSVSKSCVAKVYQYIKNQKKHHSQKSFENEYDDMIKIYLNNPEK